MTLPFPDTKMSEHWLSIGRRATPGERWGLALCGFALTAGFLLALALEPDPRGYGTHQRLGLPECTFMTMFARPCPGCGMTTSFAHFVRGHWQQSYAANPAGLLMAVSCAGLIPWCWCSAIRGRMWLVADPWAPLAILMASWGCSSVLVWIVRWQS